MASYGTPQSPTPARLRAHFDPLPFPARMSALAAYARNLSPDAYTALRDALDASTEAGDRHTALFLATVRRDLDAVAAALTDPVLRRRALSAAIRLPVPDEPLTALALSDIRAVRHETYRVLRVGRRRALADRLLPRVHAAHGPDDAAWLLPACTPATVADWLPRLDPPPGVLHTLARTAPAAVAARLAADCAAQDPHGRQRLAARYELLATAIAERDIRAGLDLFARAPALLGERAVVSLLRAPREVLAILRQAAAHEEPGGGVPRIGNGRGRWANRPRLSTGARPLSRSALRALRALTPGERAALAEESVAVARRSSPWRFDVRPDPLLALLPPAERRRVVERGMPARGPGRRTGYDALAALDPADRADLVREAFDRDHPSPETRNQLAVVMPFAEAEPVLLRAAESHRHHEREHAWCALLACAELNGVPEGFARAVAACERAWHDQEEVRRAVLKHAAAAAPRLLAAVPLTALREATLATVHSRDSRADTLAAAERWLRRTAESAAARGDTERAAYTAELLCRVLADPRRTGPVAPLRLDRRAAAAVWAAVTVPDGFREPGSGATAHAEARGEVLGGARDETCGETRGGARRTAVSRLVPLAELLVAHLAGLPALDALMGRTALEDEDPALAGRAAAVWTADFATREERCARLVTDDPSFALVERVLYTLATRRTDLLEDVLRAARHGLTGRLAPRGVRGWVPRLPRPVTGRWLPGTRRLLTAHLAAVAADEEVDLRERADAAGLLRDGGPLRELVDRAPLPVASAALMAWGHCAPEEGAAPAGRGPDEHWPSAGDRRAATGTGVRPPETDGFPGPVLSLLLHHAGAGGARGRAAMGAMRQVLASVPDRAAVAALEPVVRATDAPVGSRKEAARALVELPGETAFAALLAAWDEPGQHRDVRAVLARGLLARIGEPGVADRLTSRAHEPAVRDATVLAHPGRAVVRDHAAYASWLAGLARDAEDATAEAACEALPAWTAVGTSGEAEAALADAVLDPGRPARVWRDAAAGLAAVRTEAAPAALRRVVDTLLERARTGDGQGGTPSGEDRRAEALRRLTGCASAVLERLGRWWGTEIATADTVVDGLLAAGLRREATGAAYSVASAALRRGDGAFARWERYLALVEERPDRLTGRETYLSHEDAVVREATLGVVRALRERGGAAAGLTALMLVSVIGPHSGWAEVWRSELEALRRYDDPDTAEQALLIEARARR
ncbi:hypothetical protein [Streptomyces cucumeris]|uniref:hypothetical protein n=1 Tax=Streptomyces cucumeris TaxID=2962890 RepID=UPI003EBEC5CF